MVVYSNKTTPSRTEHQHKRDGRLRTNIQSDNETLSSFAQEAANDALGANWVHPDSRDFVDRRPQQITATVSQKESTDIVSALLAAKRRRT